MDLTAQELGGRSIDHPMPLHRAAAFEQRTRDDHVEMAAFARPGVPGMLCAVVADLQLRGRQGRFEGATQSVDPRAHACAFGAPRMIQKMRPAVNTNTSGITTQVLKVTQVSSLS